MTGGDHIRRFATLGNHLPRQCGIATFTTHLTDALLEQLPGADGFVLAMNDAGRRHAYPSRVRFEIGESDLASYRRAADFLNVNQVDVLSVQHEYGIFGGKAGAHLLELLRDLRMPIVTTLHTILSEPNPSQRMVLEELARLSERLDRDERVRRRPAQTRPWHFCRPDRSDSARNSRRSRGRRQQGPPRPRREDRDPDLRAAVSRQGDRIRRGCAARDPRRPPEYRLRRARRDASPRDRA